MCHGGGECVEKSVITSRYIFSNRESRATCYNFPFVGAWVLILLFAYTVVVVCLAVKIASRYNRNPSLAKEPVEPGTCLIDKSIQTFTEIDEHDSLHIRVQLLVCRVQDESLSVVRGAFYNEPPPTSPSTSPPITDAIVVSESNRREADESLSINSTTAFSVLSVTEQLHLKALHVAEEANMLKREKLALQREQLNLTLVGNMIQHKRLNETIVANSHTRERMVSKDIEKENEKALNRLRYVYKTFKHSHKPQCVCKHSR
uniref:Uncharacterized protein n=1 Tax=Pyramimonas orientalis virus TaxID=455367 RepID=A0A7L9AZ44_POV01|nr:hypothetical protein HWQ62_00449 [Pyramimonas orientalis virus]